MERDEGTPVVDIYTITITPADPRGTGASITVEIDPDECRIREIAVLMGELGAPFPEALSRLELAPLFESMTLLSQGQLKMQEGGAPSTPAHTASSEESETSGSRASRGDAQGDKSTGGRRSSTKKATPAHGAPADLAKMYWRLGSTAKVATHYNVPHAVARDWVQDLRKTGAAPDPWQSRRAPRR